MHVAGASITHIDGLEVIEDDHTPNVLEETWTIFDHLAQRATNLRAIVLECERNSLRDCLPVYRRLTTCLRDTPFGQAALKI